MIGRRVYVTVLFSDVSDSSELAERLEAEEYARLLERFREFAREIVPRHGGTIARLQGDGVLALFGHLEPSEDDGRRATEAALELHAAIGQLRAGVGARATALHMHSGVHGGLVLLLAGDIERGRYDVVGEVPNTAARLCALAAPGEVAVSDESLGPRAANFVATQTGALKIRGRSDPLSVRRITARATAPGRRIDAAITRGTLPFIGREDVIDELLAGVGQAAIGSTQAIVLMGEPGIGKTRTMAEFAARLDRHDATVLQGYCESYLAAEPMQPFLQCARALAEPGDADPPVADALAALARMRSDNATSADAVTARTTMLELLRARAQHRLLVLLLDDWQWADDASRALLRALWSFQERMVVVLAVRPMPHEDLAFPEARILHLTPFDEAQSSRAIASRLPGADPFVIDEIAAKAGGTPLFIEELCHALAAGVEVRTAGYGRGLSWVNALIASRLSCLPAAQAECLRVASIIGTVVDLRLMEQLLGTGPVDQLTASLEELDFVAPAELPGTIRFRHTLTRDAIYATIDLDRRRDLHGRVARPSACRRRRRSSGGA